MAPWIAPTGRVSLDRLEITKARFPEAPDNGSNALAIVREVLPSGARTVSLDYLITALGFEQAAARQGPSGLKHTPPDIIWATNRTVLVLIDGEPVLRPIPGTALERVVNTPALLVRDKANGDVLPRRRRAMVRRRLAQRAVVAGAKSTGRGGRAGLCAHERPACAKRVTGAPDHCQHESRGIAGDGRLA